MGMGICEWIVGGRVSEALRIHVVCRWMVRIWKRSRVRVSQNGGQRTCKRGSSSAVLCCVHGWPKDQEGNPDRD